MPLVVTVVRLDLPSRALVTSCRVNRRETSWSACHLAGLTFPFRYDRRSLVNHAETSPRLLYCHSSHRLRRMWMVVKAQTFHRPGQYELRSSHPPVQLSSAYGLHPHNPGEHGRDGRFERRSIASFYRCPDSCVLQSRQGRDLRERWYPTG